MIAVKTGPAWHNSRPLREQLAASVWLFESDGKNSDGEMLPRAEDLERAHVWLELMFLEQS